MADNFEINRVAKLNFSASKSAKNDAIQGLDFADALAATSSTNRETRMPSKISNSAQRDLSRKIELVEADEKQQDEISDSSNGEIMQAQYLIAVGNSNTPAVADATDANLNSGQNNLTIQTIVSGQSNAANLNTKAVSDQTLANQAATLLDAEHNIALTAVGDGASEGTFIPASTSEQTQNTSTISQTNIAGANPNDKSAALKLAETPKPSEQNNAKTTAPITSEKAAQFANNDHNNQTNSDSSNGQGQSNNNGQSQTANVANNGLQISPNSAKSAKIESAAAKIESAKPAALAADPTNNLMDQTQTQTIGETTANQAQTNDTSRVNMPALAATITRKHLNGDKSIFVRLDPAELGGIRVELKFGANKKLTAIINVEKIEALKELSNNSANLLQSLRDSGLEVADNAIEFQLDQSLNQQNQSQRWAGENQNANKYGTASNIIDETEIKINNETSAKSTTPHLEIWKRARVSLEA